MESKNPFDLVIACDWSAGQGRSARPRPDRCWLAWSSRSQPDPAVAYAPTRLEAEAAIVRLLHEHADARTLLGIDVAIGYPLDDSGRPVLPIGRELCAMLAGMIRDDELGRNNRFEVAAALNARIARRTGAPLGPFWGRPASQAHLQDLPAHRPTGTRVRPLRSVDRLARRPGSRPQSPWQLLGVGCVGSQSLMALGMLHRLLHEPGLADRAHLWPFEPVPKVPASITIAEIYPSMLPTDAHDHWCKDARQVLAACRWLRTLPGVPTPAHPDAAMEGWILGVEAREDAADRHAAGRPGR
ncbi:MAG: hypothetical protein KatS3mg103_0888 [Phycisphaerales bacterium]|nr:MAG: hypothetical protein KatS3mg103_0888 [Phycisphaerales bacterium]